MFGRSTISCWKNIVSASHHHHQPLCCLLIPHQQLLTSTVRAQSVLRKSQEDVEIKVLPASTTTGALHSNPSGFVSKEDIEALLHRHQVKGVSMPVRREFISSTPLKTQDLQAIDIHVYHRKPETFSDHVAFRTVKFLRFFADAFFRERYVHRAIVLETVAGVPGMVAGMFCHFKSLRRMQSDNGWIKKLLDEAENERMHLMIWMSVTKVGYLEEEAIVSYNGFAKEISQGRINNSPAPKIAIDYYNLDKQASLLDVVYAVRADEAAHRDANHNFADKIDARNEKLD